MRSRRYTLCLSCPDRIGIVAAVARYVADQHGWILEASHYADEGSGRFFLRQEILATSLRCNAEQFEAGFAPIAADFDMRWQLADSAKKKRLAILVSKQEHCLYDLLARWKSGELEAEISCVISNHDDFRGVVEWHGIPFHRVAVNPDTRSESFAKIASIIANNAVDCVVLARYMQILPPTICSDYEGRMLNIHHSFLPSFVGAKPYHQAYERGVKLIGATCHYVTTELDQGPIIEQDVIRIDHSDSVEDMVRYGRDIEKSVLARGLRYHLEDRVLMHGNKTVVFR